MELPDSVVSNEPRGMLSNVYEMLASNARQCGVFHGLSQVVQGRRLENEAKKYLSAQAMITL